MLKGTFLALFRSTLNLEFDIELVEIFPLGIFPIYYLSPWGSNGVFTDLLLTEPLSFFHTSSPQLRCIWKMCISNKWDAYKTIWIIEFLFISFTRVRFLLGGRHGEFKFLPPAGYAPCYEALLPKEKMRVEPVKEYKRDMEGVRDLLGTTQFLSQASFIPVPVNTSQVGP